MSKKRSKSQHYVPKAYLSQWETTVESIKEPKKLFTGVYYFEGDSQIGDGRNKDSILWEPHLYTIRFDKLYIGEGCPLVYTDFVKQVFEYMQEKRSPPVYGKLGYSTIKTKNSVRKHLLKVDDWDFYYSNNKPAPKSSILRDIHGINSYILENGFDEKYEKSWRDLLNTFIIEMRNPSNGSIGKSERIIDMDLTQKVFSFFLMMHCRSPQFNGKGILDWLDTPLREIFVDESDSVIESVWYTELYRLLKDKKVGHYHELLLGAIEHCQMVFYEAQDSISSFITSDNPAFLNQQLAPEVNNHTGYIFPLSPKYLLFIGRGSGNLNVIDYRFADRKLVCFFNRIIYRNRSKAVVASLKNLKDLL